MRKSNEGARTRLYLHKCSKTYMTKIFNLKGPHNFKRLALESSNEISSCFPLMFITSDQRPWECGMTIGIWKDGIFQSPLTTTRPIRASHSSMGTQKPCYAHYRGKQELDILFLPFLMVSVIQGDHHQGNTLQFPCEERRSVSFYLKTHTRKNLTQFHI